MYKRLWSAHVLKVYRVCAYKLGVHLEVWQLQRIWLCQTNDIPSPRVVVGFIPRLVLSIFLQDEYQKWGPLIYYMEGKI